MRRSWLKTFLTNHTSSLNRTLDRYSIRLPRLTAQRTITSSALRTKRSIKMMSAPASRQRILSSLWTKSSAALKKAKEVVLCSRSAKGNQLLRYRSSKMNMLLAWEAILSNERWRKRRKPFATKSTKALWTADLNCSKDKNKLNRFKSLMTVVELSSVRWAKNLNKKSQSSSKWSKVHQRVTWCVMIVSSSCLLYRKNFRSFKES